MEPLPPIDPLFRLGYRSAHRLLRLWWRLRRPVALGAAVAVWDGERLLVIRTSYHDQVDLPGGGLDRGEAPKEGAVRELREETGIEAPAGELAEAGPYAFEDLHRRITAWVFAWRPVLAPVPVIDRREIVWAGYLDRAALDRAPLSPLLRLYLGHPAADGDGPA
jgi:8-oxo-dGTP pyrophosphatase MutT (NUDIX family)